MLLSHPGPSARHGALRSWLAAGVTSGADPYGLADKPQAEIERLAPLFEDYRAEATRRAYQRTAQGAARG